jgi:protein MpaA
MKNFFVENIGNTELKQSIDCWNFNITQNNPYILIIGGVHGDEIEGVEVAEEIVKFLISQDNRSSPLNIGVKIIPILNKDGFILNKRSNYNDVDLNRNLSTSNWSKEFENERYKPGPEAGSEQETKAFLKIINTQKPDLIISCHSYKESLILYNGITTPFYQSILDLAASLNIPVVTRMSYETKGSLNTLGKELDIPIITMEFIRGKEWERKKNETKIHFLNFISKLMPGNINE